MIGYVFYGTLRDTVYTHGNEDADSEHSIQIVNASMLKRIYVVTYENPDNGVYSNTTLCISSDVERLCPTLIYLMSPFSIP